jgi:hypothetical protein
MNRRHEKGKVVSPSPLFSTLRPASAAADGSWVRRASHALVIETELRERIPLNNPVNDATISLPALQAWASQLTRC